uniref:Uncharacterized protein n=1 Tax=Candidatus Kentrum sp. FM TaxID=2126340 RepID=A0A450SFI6_9GAMM|nr:MAG: hypothetical protein BECKFM1743C_GA0114222_100993 [Candidatus Kentron sp. FM]
MAHAPAARLESERKSCAIWYILFCQSPKETIHEEHSAENRNRLKKRSTKDAKEHEEDTEFFLSSLRLCASAVINSLCGVWERRINRRGAETQRRKKKTFTKNKKWPDSNTAQPSRNRWSWSSRYRKSPIRSIAIANRDIDSEPVPYGNGCMKSVQEKQEMAG